LFTSFWPKRSKSLVETTPEQKRLAKELQTIANFWDSAFKEGQPSPLTAADFQPSQKLNQDILSYGKKANKALDFGAGVDLLFLEAALEGATFEGLNLDPSEAATKLHQGYIDLSKVTTLHCQKGGLAELAGLPDGSFDLIVISNVIDVLPEEETQQIVESVKRLLAPKGIFLLKTNFFIDEEMIQKRGMKLTDGKLYMDGVLRAVNRTDESWIAKFKSLTLADSYPYERIPNGPKDRCFVFRNND
jgi:Methyltransferase domain.